jgi:hypothetical protein
MEPIIAAGLTVLVGCGVIAALMKLNATVGRLCAEVKNLAARLTDHEERIRELERSR